MKIKLIACLTILIFSLSCGSDDDTSASFIGTWEATNIDITDCENFTNDDFRSVQCNENSCYRMIFNSDKTYSFQTGLSIEIGTWEASGASITFCYEDEEDPICRTGTGVLAGTTSLRLSFEEGNEGCITGYIMEKSESETPVDDGN